MNAARQPLSPIVYLSEADLDALDIGMPRLVDVLEAAFRLKHAPDTWLPPKIFYHVEGDRFYTAMLSASAGLGFAIGKYQSGYPDNPASGLPYIQGLMVLNEHPTGQMVAIMDAKWVTGKRTAAASALVARYQAREGAETLCLLGCGLQGRAHLEALTGEVKSLRRCRVHDANRARAERFVRDLDGRYNGVDVVACDTAKDALADADIAIPGGPIELERKATILPDWIKPGALIVTIDYDSYVTDECIGAMDLVLTDDAGQIRDAQARGGKFTGVTRIDGEVADLIVQGVARRRSDDQRILAFNLGIALEDLATGVEVYRRATEKGVGQTLKP